MIIKNNRPRTVRMGAKASGSKVSPTITVTVTVTVTGTGTVTFM